MNKNRKQFTAFVRKEFYHIFRDVRSTVLLLIMPIVLVVLFGYAITTEIKSAPIALFDQSQDDITSKLTDQIESSEYFKLYKSVQSKQELDELFTQGKIRLAIVFPPQFSAAAKPSIQILADATDPNEATTLIQYATAIMTSSEAIKNKVQSNKVNPGITPIVNLLYNPQMKGAYNFVPGVMGLILILICAMMTSVGIVKEKELGTMEVLLVSPLKPIYIILAKTIPYLIISMINIVTILLLSRFLLGVPIVGSITLLMFASILYALVALSLGLLISTVVDTQKSAMLISMMALMLPVMLLSGMIFPIENMPLPLQVISNIVPAKWYIMIVKDSMIKGVGFEAVREEIGILLFMIIVLIGISVKRFKIRL